MSIVITGSYAVIRCECEKCQRSSKPRRLESHDAYSRDAVEDRVVAQAYAHDWIAIEGEGIASGSRWYAPGHAPKKGKRVAKKKAVKSDIPQRVAHRLREVCRDVLDCLTQNQNYSSGCACRNCRLIRDLRKVLQECP